MQKRLGIGFLKGGLVALAVGLGVQFGLRWPTPSGSLLAYLLAMGASGTAGVFGGRAPWRPGAGFEALLKMLVGVAAGAGLYFVASRYAPLEIPLPGGPAPWTAVPGLFLAPIGALYGALVELDHEGETGPRKDRGVPSEGGKARASATEIEDAEVVSSTKAKR
jgi:hypothetical protein